MKRDMKRSKKSNGVGHLTMSDRIKLLDKQLKSISHQRKEIAKGLSLQRAWLPFRFDYSFYAWKRDEAWYKNTEPFWYETRYYLFDHPEKELEWVQAGKLEYQRKQCIGNQRYPWLFGCDKDYRNEYFELKIKKKNKKNEW